jgi:hypothetical protein
MPDTYLVRFWTGNPLPEIMAKKQYFAILDTETSITDKVADFGIIVCDRNGNIYSQCAVLVNGIFGVDSLFFDVNASGIWAKTSVTRRMDKYNTMLENGTRMLASINAINRWLEKAAAKYNPTLTAYNLAFDRNKCENTGIDLNMFHERFCLWQAAVGNICNTKPYREFVLNNHLFNTPTEKGNMTFFTTAEAVTGYLTGQMTDEPHTSIEDVIGYELPILQHILKKKDWKNRVIPYDWNKHQVKNHFKAV